MELELESDIGCMGIFRMVLYLYVAEVVLSRVILGGSLVAGRARGGGAGCCIFGCTSFWGVVLEGRFKCNSIDVLDAVMLAGLWRQRGETGLRIVVWAFNVGRVARHSNSILTPSGGRLSWLTLCISLFWGRELVHASLLRFLRECDVAHPGDSGNWNKRKRIKAGDLLAHDLNPLITASRKWRS